MFANGVAAFAEAFDDFFDIFFRYFVVGKPGRHIHRMEEGDGFVDGGAGLAVGVALGFVPDAAGQLGQLLLFIGCSGIGPVGFCDVTAFFINGLGVLGGFPVASFYWLL